MTGSSLPKNYTDNPERLVRRARPRVVPPLAILPAQEPISEAPLVLETMAEKTLREFSVPSTDNVATGPNINVGDVNFKLKSSLINMVQACPFCGKLNEDANAYLQNFREALPHRCHTGCRCRCYQASSVSLLPAGEGETVVL